MVLMMGLRGNPALWILEIPYNVAGLEPHGQRHLLQEVRLTCWGEEFYVPHTVCDLGRFLICLITQKSHDLLHVVHSVIHHSIALGCW